MSKSIKKTKKTKKQMKRKTCSGRGDEQFWHLCFMWQVAAQGPIKGAEG